MRPRVGGATTESYSHVPLPLPVLPPPPAVECGKEGFLGARVAFSRPPTDARSVGRFCIPFWISARVLGHNRWRAEWRLERVWFGTPYGY